MTLSRSNKEMEQSQMMSEEVMFFEMFTKVHKSSKEVILCWQKICKEMLSKLRMDVECVFMCVAMWVKLSKWMWLSGFSDSS